MVCFEGQFVPQYDNADAFLFQVLEGLDQSPWDPFSTGLVGPSILCKELLSGPFKKEVLPPPPILPRSWAPLLGPGFHFEKHFFLVRDGFSENYKDDLLWLVALRAVKVRDSLWSWGYIASDCCTKCNLKETIDHCFLNCARVKRVWCYFSPTLSTLLSSSFVSNCLFTFFFFWPATNPKYARIARYLVKSILHVIWKFRNKCTFHNGTERSSVIIKYIIQDVKCRIHVGHFRLSPNAFKTAWESPLCGLTCDSLVVSFLQLPVYNIGLTLVLD